MNNRDFKMFNGEYMGRILNKRIEIYFCYKVEY